MTLFIPVNRLLLLSFLTLSSSPATAAGDALTVSGFGTLGAVHSNYKLADYVATSYQAHGAGYTRSLSMAVDSRVGLQVDADITDKLSAVVQAISRQNSDGNFRPAIEWANVKYKLSPDLAIRVGRTVLPSFDRSDTQNVGYSLPWARIPNSIAVTNPARTSDGADISYRLQAGSVTHNLQLQLGKTNSHLITGGFDIKRLVAAVDTMQSGNTSIHVAFEAMDYSYAGGPVGYYKLASLGGTYDPGQWFITGDSNYSVDEVFGKFFSWYLSGGVRIGNFAPYLIFSKIKERSPGTFGLTTAANEQDMGGGVRWDFMKNTDLKLQVQRVKNQNLDYLTSFWNLQTAAKVDDKATVISLTLDFIF